VDILTLLFHSQRQFRIIVVSCTGKFQHKMTRNLNIGDTVWVPCSRLNELSQEGVAMFRSKVVRLGDRSATIELPGGVESDFVAMSLLHRDVGILVINIGDLETERSLLDPLAKSLAQFVRLIAPQGEVRSIRVRSLEELKIIWHKEQAKFSHVVWIGHGSREGIKFGVEGLVSSEDLVQALRVYGAPSKVFISLSCLTGYKKFGGVVSSSAICKDFIGPKHSVPGAVASQFCQTFLINHLLEGKTTKVAFRHARQAVPGSTSFWLWRGGKSCP
jgi:hypothetical protein